MEDGADLEGIEIAVGRNDVESGAVGVLHLAQGGDPDGGREFLHAALEGLQLHHGTEGLDPFLIFRRGLGHAAVDGVVVRRRETGDVGLEVQLELGLPFTITCSNELSHKLGLLFYSFAPNSLAYQGGYLCVDPPTSRTAVQNSGGTLPPDNCSGAYSFDFNARIQSGVDPLLSLGADVFAQFWSRDPASTNIKTGLTSAVHFAIQP